MEALSRRRWRPLPTAPAAKEAAWAAALPALLAIMRGEGEGEGAGWSERERFLGTPDGLAPPPATLAPPPAFRWTASAAFLCRISTW